MTVSGEALLIQKHHAVTSVIIVPWRAWGKAINKEEDSMAGVTVNSPFAAKPRNFTTAPDLSYYGEVFGQSRQRRGWGDLIQRRAAHQRRDSKNQQPSGVHHKSSSRTYRKFVATPIALCRGKIDGAHCWSVAAEDGLVDGLKSQVDTLLYSNDHRLYRRHRRALSVHYELFLVGQSSGTAGLAMIISCTSREDKERVQKLIKKYPYVPEYTEIRFIVMLGSPRSSVPLIALASRSSIDMTSDEDDIPVADQMSVTGTRVYSSLNSDGCLKIPGTVWMGDGSTFHHKITVGGLLVNMETGKQMGLTVAHSPSIENRGYYASTPREATQRKAVGTMFIPPSNEDRQNLDWALIHFDNGIGLEASDLPPQATRSAPLETTSIRVMTARGSIRGSLSGSVTYVNINKTMSSTKVRPIDTELPLRESQSVCKPFQE